MNELEESNSHRSQARSLDLPPDLGVPSRTKSTARLLEAIHVVEKIYAVIVFGMIGVQIVHNDFDTREFVLLWSILAMLAIAASLWPRTPTLAAIYAEAFLTLLALGKHVADNPRWLPGLGHISIVSNLVPLQQRRFLAWNMLGALLLALTSIPAIYIYVNRPSPWTLRGIAQITGVILVAAMFLVLLGCFAYMIFGL